MPPVDVFAEAEGLKRRRALLQALQQRSAAPEIQGTPGQGIAQLLAALGTSALTRQGLDKLDSREAELGQMRQQGVNQELASFLERMNGTPDQPLPPDQAGPPQLGIPGDPKAAILSAMTSRYPEMQDIGKGMLPSLIKPPKEPKEPKEPKIETRYAPDGTMQVFKDGVLVSEGPRGQYAKPEKPLVNIDNYPKAEEKAAEEQHKLVIPGGKLYDQAQAAQEYIDTAKEAVVSLRDATPGTGEAWLAPIRGMVARFTGADPATISTQTLGAQLANLTLKAAGGSFGNQVSDGDRKFIAEANGAVNMTPEAIKRILAIQTAVSMKRQFPYMRGLSEVTKRGGAFAGAEAFALQVNNNIEGMDPEFVRMVENVLQGKESTRGLPPTPVAPIPARPAPRRGGGGSGSGIIYTPRGG